MKKLMTLIYLLAITFSLNALALTEQELKKEFNQFFYDTSISPRHCGLNIESFLLHLKRRGLNTDEIDVVKITAGSSSWGIGRVLAINSRFGKSIESNSLENWYFHMIAVHKGKVYDFSFNKYPLVLSVKEYLKKMFIPHTPFMPWGSSFRIGGGQGPYYTSEIANNELMKFIFDIYEMNYARELEIKDKAIKTEKFISRYSP